MTFCGAGCQNGIVCEIVTRFIVDCSLHKCVFVLRLRNATIYTSGSGHILNIFFRHTRTLSQTWEVSICCMCNSSSWLARRLFTILCYTRVLKKSGGHVSIIFFLIPCFYWKVFSSSHGLKMGRVAGYSIFCFLLRVPSSLRKGYVASMMGSCSLIGFSRLLGVTTNWKEQILLS